MDNNNTSSDTSVRSDGRSMEVRGGLIMVEMVGRCVVSVDDGRSTCSLWWYELPKSAKWNLCYFENDYTQILEISF